ncbi:basic leucine zipper 61-like [Canna indica]|uniref:Basic leucine zipper 61-like n=1 Tax=Canna indica TaxID=4628 RepID=A0AAQ3QLF1_9LILI|nr:basic leucine zipper 61-like [Canna indica]
MSSDTNNWSYFGNDQHTASSSALPSAGDVQDPFPSPSQQQPASSWAIDEFLDFSAARRGLHRRSASDTAAFLEGAPLEFDRLDDGQILSMFSDELQLSLPPPPSLSTPSTPSDQHSQHEDQQPVTSGPEEAQSTPSKTEATTDQAAPSATEPEMIVDPRRVRRILANRQSAQRSRVRKLQYIAELERNVTKLQSEVSALSPRVAFLDHQRSVLAMGNSYLKQRIAALAQDKVFKDAHQESLKKELERLRHVCHYQNVDIMAASNSEPIGRNYFNDITEDKRASNNNFSDLII